MERPNYRRFFKQLVGGKTSQQPLRKYAVWSGATLLILGLLAVCAVSFGGRNSTSATFMRVGSGLASENYSQPAAMPTPAAAAADGVAADAMRSKAYSAESQGAQAVPAGGAAGGPSISGQSQPQPQNKPWDRKIIRTATLQVTVKDVGSSVDRVRLLADQHGGYVFQSDSHADGDYTIATITIQVPTQEFDRIMPELRKLDGQVKKITSENVASSDVTEEYTDLNSQLRNLQATEARVIALQQKADKLEDILTLDQQLRQIQGDIERIQGRLTFISNRSDMSSITVTLNPDKPIVEPTVEPTPEAAKVWDPAAVAQKAWDASLQVLSGVATVAITIGVFLWWLIPIVLIAFVVAVRGRKRSGGAITPSGQQAPPTAPMGEAGA